MRLTVGTCAAVTTAILVRWAFCLLIFPAWLTDLGSVGDQYYFDSYREIAAQVLSGNGYRAMVDAIPCLHRPPGYVGILLLSFPRHQLSYIAVQLINGVLGGIATWLTITMAGSWGLSHRAALFAGWSIALWPFLIWETKITVPENLLVALVPAAFAALGRWRTGRSTVWLLATGLLAGMAALTHALYQLFLPCLLITVFFVTEPRHWKRRATALCVVGGTCLAVIAPWVVRNTRIAGRPIGIATGFGLHYLRGLHSWKVLTSEAPYFRDHDTDSAAFVDDLLLDASFDDRGDYFVRSDPDINRFLDAAAWSDIRTRPGQVVLRAIIRSPVVWIHQRNLVRSLATALLILPFLALAFSGILRGRRRDLLSLVLPLITLTMAAAAIYPEAIPARYSLPLLPLLVVLSARGFEISWPRDTQNLM